MKATRFILVLALAAGTTAGFAASAAAAGPSDPTSASTYATHGGAYVVVQNQAEKHRLESQGFPQYND
jgi:hypothetical protein